MHYSWLELNKYVANRRSALVAVDAEDAYFYTARTVLKGPLVALLETDGALRPPFAAFEFEPGDIPWDKLPLLLQYWYVKIEQLITILYSRSLNRKV